LAAFLLKNICDKSNYSQFFSIYAAYGAPRDPDVIKLSYQCLMMNTDACPAHKNLKSFGFNIPKYKVLMKHRKFLKYAHSRASGGRVVRRVTFKSRQ
jgi:hypothetical protein